MLQAIYSLRSYWFKFGSVYTGQTGFMVYPSLSEHLQNYKLNRLLICILPTEILDRLSQ